MEKFNQLSEKEKVRILVNKREGWSKKKIAKHLKLSKLAIRYYLKNLNEKKFEKTCGRMKNDQKRC